MKINNNKTLKKREKRKKNFSLKSKSSDSDYNFIIILLLLLHVVLRTQTNSLIDFHMFLKILKTVSLTVTVQ